MGSAVCPFILSILERSGENGADVLVYVPPVCFMMVLVRDDWRLESWCTVTSWKWMSLKVEHAAAVDAV